VNAELARGALGDAFVEEVLPDDPPWETPIAFFAALHYLALSGRAPELEAAYAGHGELWPAARAVLDREREWVREFVHDQPVQTNEVQRCWTLLPGFLAAARGGGPIELVELGPSAGLNLCWDRYRYRYPELEWGPESPVVLEGDWRCTFRRELFERVPEVRRRIGIDRSPIDATTDEGALLLQSFLWADQPDRLARLRAAIDVLRRDPPELVRGDYVELLPDVLAQSDSDALTIVFHSASTQYLDDASFRRIESAIASASGAVAWLSMEPERGTDNYGDFFLDLHERRSGRARRLAQVHYHGAWIDWRA
jgi:hypothetical protein